MGVLLVDSQLSDRSLRFRPVVWGCAQGDGLVHDLLRLDPGLEVVIEDLGEWCGQFRPSDSAVDEPEPGEETLVDRPPALGI